MARPARSKKPEEANTEANLIPIMNIMFLLIPALLLAMEVARHAAVPVSTPKTTSKPTTTTSPTEEVQKFSVKIRGDGFSTAHGTVTPEVDIPILVAEDTHDYATLESKAATLRSLYPEQYTVFLSAEGDIPLDTVVKTMDALRGSNCSLGGVLSGERAGKDCNFWNVVIES